MIQSASTPPPSPPSAAIRMLTGRSGRAMIALGRLQPADDRAAPAVDPPVEEVGVLNDLRAEKRRAQYRRVRDLAAESAADAGVVDVRHRIRLERVARGLDRERRATRETDAGMVAGAHVFVDAEAGAHHALARLEG